MIYRTIIFPIAALMLSNNVFSQELAVQEQPLNVILMIGDGMGLSQLSATYYYKEDKPIFSKFKYIGLMKTSSATDKVTDSAASATAISTGTKTYNGAIGVDPDTIPQENLVEIASRQGYLTGVVATSSVTDATPAGFYAHSAERSFHHEIALDLVTSDIDFFAGGGLQHFIDTTGKDLFKDNNIEVNFSKLKKIRKPEPEKRYGFLLAPDGMPPILNGRGDYLPKAVQISVDFLSTNDEGFFLMIEGSQIDWAGHSNHTEYMITEMNDFEDAVRVAFEFAESDGNTLVIVTADHETGGFTLGAAGENGYNADYSTIAPTFASTNHSAALVPVLAYGPGAETFIGIYENSDIFHKIKALILSE